MTAIHIANNLCSAFFIFMLSSYKCIDTAIKSTSCPIFQNNGYNFINCSVRSSYYVKDEPFFLKHIYTLSFLF